MLLRFHALYRSSCVMGMMRWAEQPACLLVRAEAHRERSMQEEGEGEGAAGVGAHR